MRADCRSAVYGALWWRLVQINHQPSANLTNQPTTHPAHPYTHGPAATGRAPAWSAACSSSPPPSLAPSATRWAGAPSSLALWPCTSPRSSSSPPSRRATRSSATSSSTVRVVVGGGCVWGIVSQHTKNHMSCPGHSFPLCLQKHKIEQIINTQTIGQPTKRTNTQTIPHTKSNKLNKHAQPTAFNCH